MKCLTNMRLLVTVAGVLFCLSAQTLQAENLYDLAFSTYLGGSDDWEHARDIHVDGQGNIYIVGGTQSNTFPVTAGVFQASQDKTGSDVGSGGYCDAFVSKFTADGDLIWSTYLGGPNYDRAYAVEVDAEGYVYVAGRSGPGFPVTAGAFQTTFSGSDQGIYGLQNGFIAKVKPDGSGLAWAAYVGVNQLCRDLAIDDEGDIYLPFAYQGTGPKPPAAWFANAYQPTTLGGVDVGAVKIATDGASVLWATWFGGSGNEENACGIRLGPDKSVYLNLTTQSNNVPTTAGAHDRTYNGGRDAFIARLSPDGSSLIYGTYFGTSGNEYGNSTHNLAVDIHGNAYLMNASSSTNVPVTLGVVQPYFAGGNNDRVISKFSPAGALLLCTYLGGNGVDTSDGIYADAAGNVFMTGATSSTNFPVTAGAYQSQRSTANDATLVVLSPDFARLKYSTYMGGSSYEDGRAGYLDAQGNLYLTGSVNGGGWPTLNAYQDYFAGGGGGQSLCYEGGCYAGDVILAKFTFVGETSSVVGRKLFYNNSSFDGNDPAANTSDDDAVATDKYPLLPGQTASFSNYSSFVHGINGLMIDIDGLAGVPVAADFTFKVGNDNNPAAWADAPLPGSISVRAGAGTGGSDRITIIWPDGAIRGKWLQVTVKATAATGLYVDDVFYYGNAVGESGQAASDAIVDATDEINSRNNPRHFLKPATIDSPYDHDRDGKVDATDQIISRDHVTDFTSALKLIAVP